MRRDFRQAHGLKSGPVLVWDHNLGIGAADISTQVMMVLGRHSVRGNLVSGRWDLSRVSMSSLG